MDSKNLNFEVTFQDDGEYHYEHTFHLDPKYFLDCKDERELNERLWEVYSNQKFESIPDELYLECMGGTNISGQINEFIKEWKRLKGII